MSGRVLEIGSGGGPRCGLSGDPRSACAPHGYHPGLRRPAASRGIRRRHPRPVCDDLRDPARPKELCDAVWANACLLHVHRADLPTVLTRLRAVTRQGGLLRFSVKEGEGEAWSGHGPVAAPRLFIYWLEPELRAVVERAGWTAIRVGRVHGPSAAWLEVWASVERASRPSGRQAPPRTTCHTFAIRAAVAAVRHIWSQLLRIRGQYRWHA